MTNVCTETKSETLSLNSQKEETTSEDVVKEGDAVCFHTSNGIHFIITISPDNFYKSGKRNVRMMDMVGHKYGTIFEAQPYTISNDEKVDKTKKSIKSKGRLRKKPEIFTETFVATV